MYQLQQAEKIDSFFSQIQKNRINSLARQNLNYLPVYNYSEPWIGGSQIITMHPTAEAGMPHTRPPNIICMPQWFPESKRDVTLAHEFIHLHQRNSKEKWNTFFEKEGWSRLDPLELPPELVGKCRMNPDTIDQPFWRWKDRYVPLPIFEREEKPDLRQVVVQWYDLSVGKRYSEPPRSFLEKYGRPDQSEHPREIAAVELAPFVKTPFDIDDYLRR